MSLTVTNQVRFGDKIALHRTPNPPLRNYAPQTRPDADETVQVVKSFQNLSWNDESTDVVVLSSQREALESAGLDSEDILERTAASNGDQPDIILTDEDAKEAKTTYKALMLVDPRYAQEYADSVAEEVTRKIYQEKPDNDENVVMGVR
jgi:hypothetical protein